MGIHDLLQLVVPAKIRWFAGLMPLGIMAAQRGMAQDHMPLPFGHVQMVCQPVQLPAFAERQTAEMRRHVAILSPPIPHDPTLCPMQILLIYRRIIWLIDSSGHEVYNNKKDCWMQHDFIEYCGSGYTM